MEKKRNPKIKESRWMLSEDNVKLLTPIEDYPRILKDLNVSCELGLTTADLDEFAINLKNHFEPVTSTSVSVYLDGDFKFNWEKALMCLGRRLKYNLGFSIHQIFNSEQVKLSVKCNEYTKSVKIVELDIMMTLNSYDNGEMTKFPESILWPNIEVIWWLIFNVTLCKRLCREKPEEIIALGIIIPGVIVSNESIPYIYCFNKTLYVDITPLDDANRVRRSILPLYRS